MRPRRGSIAEPFGVLLELQQEGLIRHLGAILRHQPRSVAWREWRHRGRTGCGAHSEMNRLLHNRLSFIVGVD